MLIEIMLRETHFNCGNNMKMYMRIQELFLCTVLDASRLGRGITGPLIPFLICANRFSSSVYSKLTLELNIKFHANVDNHKVRSDTKSVQDTKRVQETKSIQDNKRNILFVFFLYSHLQIYNNSFKMKTTSHFMH